jgi:hypothetical protein
MTLKDSYLIAAGTIHAHRQHAVDEVPGRQSRRAIAKTQHLYLRRIASVKPR